MGQHYRIVNLDKSQQLRISPFNDGAKLMEFGCSQEGAMLGLAVLLADGNGRGDSDAAAFRVAVVELAKRIRREAEDDREAT